MDLQSPTHALQAFLYLSMPLPCLNARWELEISQSLPAALTGQAFTDCSSSGQHGLSPKEKGPVLPCFTYSQQTGGMLGTPGRARRFAGLRDNQTIGTFSSLQKSKCRKQCSSLDVGGVKLSAHSLPLLVYNRESSTVFLPTSWVLYPSLALFGSLVPAVCTPLLTTLALQNNFKNLTPRRKLFVGKTNFPHAQNLRDYEGPRPI